MRLLTILVLGCLPVLTLTLDSRWMSNIALCSESNEADGVQDPDGMDSLEECYIAMNRVHQKFEQCRQRSAPPSIIVPPVCTSVLWGVLPLCVGLLAGYLYQRQQTVAERLRQLELLEEFEGVKEEAFDLGRRASQYAIQLMTAQTERDDAQLQLQRLSRLRVAKTVSESSCQTDMLHNHEAPRPIESPGPLVGECSTPELEQLVVNAPVKDTFSSSMDQWTPAKPVSASKGLTVDDNDDVADLAPKNTATPVACVVEVVNPSQGKQLKVVEQAIGAADGLAATHRNSSSMAQSAPAVSAQPAVAAPGVTTAVSAAQPMQLQVQIVTSDSSLVCEQMKALLQKQDVERMEQQRQQLKAETETLSARKWQLEAEVTELQHSVYVNTSRGSRTPLAFGLTQNCSKSGFSPQPFNAQVSPGFVVPAPTEPDTSNTATSSFFRPPMPPSSMSPPGSAGSNRLSSPVHATGSSTPYTAGSSAGSGIGARSKQPVQPLPMRPLEAVSNTTPRSPRPPLSPSPAHEALKAAAERAIKTSAQRKEESAKQRQELSRLWPGSGGSVSQAVGKSSA